MVVSRKQSWAGCWVAVVACIAVPLQAAELNGYVALDWGYTHSSQPENQFFANRGESAPFARGADLDTANGDSEGPSHGLRLGVYLPALLASSVGSRLEWRMHRYRQSARSRDSFFDAGAGERYGWVQFDNSTGFGTPNGSALHTDVKQRIESQSQALLLALDFELGPQGLLSVYAGPAWKTIDLSSLAQGRLTSTVSQSEKIDSDLLGGQVGMQYRYDFARVWQAMVDVAVGTYRIESHYQGRQVQLASGTETVIARAIDEQRNATGIDLRVELSRQLTDRVRAGLYYDASKLSGVAQVAYGSVPADPAGGVLRIERASLSSHTLGLTLQAAF